MNADNTAWKEKQKLAEGFISKALEIYFQELGCNPFGDRRGT